jgi:hypothetical protein
VLRRLEQGLRETGSLTPTALVNAGRSRTVRTPANEDGIIAAVEREPWISSRDIAWELEISQPRVLEVLHDDQLHLYHYSRSAHLFSDDRPLQTQYANGYDTNTLRMSSFCTTFCGQTKRVLHVRVCSTSTTVTSGHGIILMVSANVGILSATASAFGLVSSGTLSWAPICYWTGWMLNDIVIFWKLFYRGYSSCEAEVVVSARRSSSALWGRCPAVVERDISRKVDWTWRADFIASSVAVSYSDRFFSYGDTWRSKFAQSLPGLSKISRYDFKQLWQRSMPTWQDVFERMPCGALPSTLKLTGRFEHLL